MCESDFAIPPGAKPLKVIHGAEPGLLVAKRRGMAWINAYTHPNCGARLMYLLHYAPDNASLIVRLVLEEAGLPYQTALVDRDAGAQHGPDYRAINPAGLIPALETPQGILFETGAILFWLCDRHGFGPGEAEPARLILLKWLFFLSNTVHADLRQLFYPHLYVPPEATAGHHALLTARMRRHFSLLDQAAQDAPGVFAVGGVLAPYIACLARWSVLYPEGQALWFHLADYPALATMITRLEARPATQRLIAAEALGNHAFSAPRHLQAAAT
jgi:glutathione S-transferase